MTRYICRDCNYTLKEQDKKNKCPNCSSYNIAVEGEEVIFNQSEEKPKTSPVTLILAVIAMGFASKYFIETGIIFITTKTAIMSRSTDISTGVGVVILGYTRIILGIGFGCSIPILIKRFFSKEL